MTKIEDTLRGTVAALEAFIAGALERGVSPYVLAPLPSPADLDALVAWVTAALPVVEEVREMQTCSCATEDCVPRCQHFHALNRMSCPVSK